MRALILIILLFVGQLSFGQNISCPDFFSNCLQNLQDLIVNTPNTQCRHWNGPCGGGGTIYRTGKVAIGTSSALNGNIVPGGYHLYVDGAVYASRVRVKLFNEWCDYVFDDNYDLMPLSEVERYISQNKHLPNIPSQQEIIQEDGIELKGMTLKQQEKVEEIFLHIMSFSERIEKLKEKIRQLELENKKLKK